MRSRVAEEMRRQQAEAEAELSLEDRILLLHKANALAVEIYAAANQMSVESAREVLNAGGDERASR